MSRRGEVTGADFLRNNFFPAMLIKGNKIQSAENAVLIQAVIVVFLALIVKRLSKRTYMDLIQ